MSADAPYPIECDCNYRGQPNPHMVCSECGDDWGDCDCAPDPEQER